MINNIKRKTVLYEQDGFSCSQRRLVRDLLGLALGSFRHELVFVVQQSLADDQSLLAQVFQVVGQHLDRATRTNDTPNISEYPHDMDQVDGGGEFFVGSDLSEQFVSVNYFHSDLLGGCLWVGGNFVYLFIYYLILFVNEKTASQEERFFPLFEGGVYLPKISAIFRLISSPVRGHSSLMLMV